MLSETREKFAMRLQPPIWRRKEYAGKRCLTHLPHRSRCAWRQPTSCHVSRSILSISKVKLAQQPLHASNMLVSVGQRWSCHRCHCRCGSLVDAVVHRQLKHLLGELVVTNRPI